ncbi:MAG: hypothetical protein NC827_04980 [Candidatus Omnitrophica bacterium]|nr:hypothetical protein [Candidatus Omnitrophota bacterium]MCM8802646.1 hypothetical protein [Candidatus Omnitrophota bacterium]
MWKKIIFFVFFIIKIIVKGSENLSVDFSYPDLKGDFYVNGKISFPSGSIYSDNNISVYDSKTHEEIPSKITITEKWPDSSILEVEILFLANTEKQRKYIISYGKDIKRKKKFTQTAVLPIISASIGKTPQTNEIINMPVGELLVKVDKSPDIRYYWYTVPMFALIFLTLYRARKTLKNEK